MVFKKEIVKEIVKESGVSEEDSRKVVDTFLGVIQRKLSGGDSVQITGFGTFLTKVREAHRALHPRTGEEITVGKLNMISFKPSRIFRQAVNEQP